MKKTQYDIGKEAMEYIRKIQDDFNEIIYYNKRIRLIKYRVSLFLFVRLSEVETLYFH